MKLFIGEVVSLKTAKTAIVKVDTFKQYPIYNKRIKSTKRYPVHYENIILKENDKVKFTETRPISKTKRWKVVEIIK